MERAAEPVRGRFEFETLIADFSSCFTNRLPDLVAGHLVAISSLEELLPS